MRHRGSLDERSGSPCFKAGRWTPNPRGCSFPSGPGMWNSGKAAPATSEQPRTRSQSSPPHPADLSLARGANLHGHTRPVASLRVEKGTVGRSLVLES